jgi:hypothetical protein
MATFNESVIASLALLVAAQGNLAPRGEVSISESFHVCIGASPGLRAVSRIGIDAVEGEVRGAKGASFHFMFSSNPNLPDGMNIVQGRNGYVIPPLSYDLTFIAESNGSLGIGSQGTSIGDGYEKLYAFLVDMQVPGATVKRKVFLQMWSSEDKRDVDFLKRSSASIRRCRNR